MNIGEIVKLRTMPTESWEVIDQRGEQFCLKNCEEPRMAIWAREIEVQKDKNPSKGDFFRSVSNFS